MWPCRVADRERQTPTHLTHEVVMPEPGRAGLVGAVAAGVLITVSAAALPLLWH
ncbi:hypothetical protein OG599_19520 [Streptomyces sp. NBC_01335]|uniref:hypothetical protein n=1 Tax=Streptomyces sp. NBC_01335 TaxID=2903828 RepID=UPI002E16355A|nr:hypothetical protein OG599_19520 [Streptomyces sp. NBC_01335]